jgi:hypothetical protein
MATKQANVNLFTQIWSIFLHASLGVEGWLGVGWVVDFGWFECDEDITMLDTTIPSIELQGLIMRSRAQQLCRQVNSFLSSSANDLENRLLPNDLIVIRN